MPLKNYYSLLGLSPNASADEIKSAYRELAKKYHPDKNSGNKHAEEFFKEIQEAYTVLSNPEKRKKYDLSFSYNTSQPRQKPYGTYTGNAYQYAQQQAQHKYEFHNLKSYPRKKDKSESHYIIISIGIALILLYFIISYSTSHKKNRSLESPVNIPEANINPVKEKVSQIHDYDSPYSYFFGEELSNSESKNCIIIHNSDEAEAVVCLVNNKKPNTTIRNQYMSAGSTFKMNNIPDGDYFLKVYYGTDWDSTKTYLDKKIKGGFKNEISFEKLNPDNSSFKMKQEQSGTRVSFSTYEILLDPNQSDEVEKISAEEFFKN